MSCSKGAEGKGDKMTAKKATIRPELVGELFANGETYPNGKLKYFRLEACEAEPSASFQDVADINMEVVTKPVSAFADMILFKAVSPIGKPKKPRADKGGTHRPQSERQKVGADKRSNKPRLEIHVPAEDETRYKVSIGVVGAEGDTLKEAITLLLSAFPDGKAPKGLSSYDQQIIDNVLDFEGVSR
jgi:hypothetical protein